MARNFTKEKEMRRRLYFLFTLMLGFYFFSGPISADAEEGIKLALLFSANVNGELEPCG